MDDPTRLFEDKVASFGSDIEIVNKFGRHVLIYQSPPQIVVLHSRTLIESLSFHLDNKMTYSYISDDEIIFANHNKTRMAEIIDEETVRGSAFDVSPMRQRQDALNVHGL